MTMFTWAEMYLPARTLATAMPRPVIAGHFSGVAGQHSILRQVTAVMHIVG